MLVAIDTLKVARRLREAGFSEPQAEAVVAAVQQGAEDAEIATKRDVAELGTQLRSEMREMELRLKVEIEAASGRTQNRIIGMILGALLINVLAILGSMFLLMRLFARLSSILDRGGEDQAQLA